LAGSQFAPRAWGIVQVPPKQASPPAHGWAASQLFPLATGAAHTPELAQRRLASQSEEVVHLSPEAASAVQWPHVDMTAQ
jgi:hypothetical protein